MRWGTQRLGLALLVLLGTLVTAQAHYQVPILMYHHVGESSEDSSLWVRPETFEKQMEFLKLHGYHVERLEKIVQKLRAGERVANKTVAITFDDGTLDNFTHAFPVLKKMGFPATIFMITRNIGEQGWLSEEDLRILNESGIAIGSHTVNHAHLPDLKSEEDALFELKASKEKLEKILGRPVDLLSYPAGGFTERIRGTAKRVGYRGAVTTNRGTGKNDVYALRRIKVTEAGGSLFHLWIKLSGFYHIGKKKIETG